jgi:hypothetical protein
MTSRVNPDTVARKSAVVLGYGLWQLHLVGD